MMRMKELLQKLPWPVLAALALATAGLLTPAFRPQLTDVQISSAAPGHGPMLVPPHAARWPLAQDGDQPAAIVHIKGKLRLSLFSWRTVLVSADDCIRRFRVGAREFDPWIFTPDGICQARRR